MSCTFIDVHQSWSDIMSSLFLSLPFSLLCFFIFSSDVNYPCVYYFAHCSTTMHTGVCKGSLPYITLICLHIVQQQCIQVFARVLFPTLLSYVYLKIQSKPTAYWHWQMMANVLSLLKIDTD